MVGNAAKGSRSDLVWVSDHLCVGCVSGLGACVVALHKHGFGRGEVDMSDMWAEAVPEMQHLSRFTNRIEKPVRLLGSTIDRWSGDFIDDPDEVGFVV